MTFAEECVPSGKLTRKCLVELKNKALRNRTWYRVLSRLERGLVDLTIKWVYQVRSVRLEQVLRKILGKLVLAMGNRMVRCLAKGRDLASRISKIVFEWGNAGAREWRDDLAFQLALGRGVLFGN